MEALGKVLRKGVGEGHSVHQTTQYEKLAQEPSDEDAEDDDIVFLQDGLVLHQNGFTKPSGNHTGNHKGKRCLTAEESVEIGLLQKGSVSRPKPLELVQVKSARCRMLMRRRIYWCLIILLLVLGLALIGLLAKPYYRRTQSTSKEWQKQFPGYGTESCIRLIDVDGDGRMDIIFSMTIHVNTSAMRLYNMTREEMKAFCTQRGESYPCLGRIVALRGNDSHQLWMTNVHSGLFELNCGKIDVNKDGQMDCIGSGRLAIVVAFDPRNGSVFWTADSTSIVDAWNAFNVIILPDFNGDQIPEVLLPHSSDPRFPPEVHERYAGRLILLDGATGKSIGRFLSMPQGRETYMSPVLHTMKDGSQYILFGSGGETVPGAMLAISVPDFYRHAMSLDASAPVPNVSGKYNQWTHLPRTENQLVMELYRSETKGVMVPPVCVDASGDGIADILMLAFDGNLTLFEGQSLKPIWGVTFAGMESYSSPAPGYYNADDRIDFMLHLNHGSYPDYDYSMTVVVDGKTGETLWALNSSRFEMTSDLVARTVQDHYDFFAFRVKGRLDSSKPKRKRRSFRRGSDYENKFSAPRQSSRRHYNKPGPAYDEGSLRRKPDGQNDVGQLRRGSADDYPGPEIDEGRNIPSDDDVNPPLGRDYNAGQSEWDGPGRWSEPDGTHGRDYGFDDGQTPEEVARLRSESLQRQSGTYRTAAREQYRNREPESRYLPPLSKTRSPQTLLDSSPTAIVTPVATHLPPQTSFPPPGRVTNCSSDLPSRSTELFLLDRTTMRTPLRIYQDSPQELKYKLSTDDMKLLEGQSSESSGKKVKRHEGMPPGGSTSVHGTYDKDTELCTVLESEERTTGAIGDVDGDGFLDLISIETLNAPIFDHYGGFLYSRKTTRLSKFNLELKLKRASKRDFISVHAQIRGNSQTNATDTRKPDVRFRPFSQQPWTAYLGTNGDSIYKQIDKVPASA